MGRNIDTISFALTTHCNMACPNCCAGVTAMAKKDKVFYSWEYLAHAAKYFYGIRRINLTGGEATIHPQFEEWAPYFKQLFGCEVLSLWTNGTMFRKKKDALKHFDEIHVTNYTANTYEGSPDNTADIVFIKDHLYGMPVKVYSTQTVHITPKTKEGDNPCFRLYSETVEYVDGYVYPCCAGSGLKTKVRYELDENWMSEVQKLHPPCNECVFGEK